MPAVRRSGLADNVPNPEAVEDAAELRRILRGIVHLRIKVETDEAVVAVNVGQIHCPGRVRTVLIDTARSTVKVQCSAVGVDSRHAHGSPGSDGARELPRGIDRHAVVWGSALRA